MTTKRCAAGSRRTSKNGWLAGGPNGAGDRGQARGPSELGDEELQVAGVAVRILPQPTEPHSGRQPSTWCG